MPEPDEWLFPEISVVCHACHRDLPVPAGLNAVEAIWMHEPECAADQQGDGSFALAG